MTDLNATPETGGVPPFRKDLIEEYLKVLQQKYDELSTDPFGLRARLVVRREIETMKAFIEEHNMEESFKNLSKVFGLEDAKKPKTRNQFEEELEDNSSFRSKFSRGDSRAELNAALDII